MAVYVVATSDDDRTAERAWKIFIASVIGLALSLAYRGAYEFAERRAERINTKYETRRD
jgi:hypothetical protein